MKPQSFDRRQFVRVSSAASSLFFVKGVGFIGCVNTTTTTEGDPIDPKFCSPVDLEQLRGGFYTEYINGRENYRPTELDFDSWELEFAQTFEGEKINSAGFDFAALQRPNEEETFFQTFQCVGYRPGSPLVSNGYFTAVPLRVYLQELSWDLTQAKRVNFRCFDGYESNHPIERVMASDSVIYLAYGFDGVPLSDRRDGSMKHGHPVRIVCRDMMGMKSPKALVQIEVTDDDTVIGHWENFPVDSRSAPDTNWSDAPFVKVNSKVFDPVNLQSIKRKHLIKGTAWSGSTPLSRVEVAVAKEDVPTESLQWHAATLQLPNVLTAADKPAYDNAGDSFDQALSQIKQSATPVPYVWTVWSVELEMPGDGEFVILARAFDTNGDTQPYDLPVVALADGDNRVHVVRVFVG